MKPLSHILETALYVDDLETAERYYRDVLGLTIHNRQEGRHSFFRLDDAMFLLFNPSVTEDKSAGFNAPLHGARGQGHVAFRVETDELNGWIKHLQQHDVAIELDMQWSGGGRSVYFRDPYGNSIELATAEVWGDDHDRSRKK